MDGVQIKQEPPDYNEEPDYVLPEREPSPPLGAPMETPAVKVEIDEEMHEASVEEMHEVTVEEVVKKEDDEVKAAAKEEPPKFETVKVKEEPKDVEEVEVKEEPKDGPNLHPVAETVGLTGAAMSIPGAAGVPTTTILPSTTVLPAGCRMVLVPAQVVNQAQSQNHIIAGQNNVVATPITLPVGQAAVIPPRVILPAEQRNGVVPTQVVRPMLQQNGVAEAAQDVPWAQLWIQPTGATSVTPASDEAKEPPQKKTRIEYSEGAVHAVYTEPSTNTKGGKIRRDVQTQFPTWDFVEERSSGTQTCGGSQTVSECGIQTTAKNENTTLVSSGTGTTEPWPPNDDDDDSKSSGKGGQKKKAGGGGKKR